MRRAVFPARALLAQGQEPSRSEAFIARARPLARRRVPGRRLRPGEVSRRRLCRFHDHRLLRQHTCHRCRADELAAWVAGERPLLGAHQFSLAGLPELLRTELLYALQQRDQAPPPLDPAQVRILLARLGGAASLREADPQVVCESGGHAVQLRDPRAVPRPAPAPGPGPGGAHRRRPVRRRGVAGGAAGPAAQRLPALARHPGDDRLPGRSNWPGCARSHGTGPAPPALPAAAARDAARLPGRLARPGRRRAHRPGQPGGRGLHPHPRRDQRAAASRRDPVLRQPPQPDDLPVLPGHRARPRPAG